MLASAHGEGPGGGTRTPLTAGSRRDDTTTVSITAARSTLTLGTDSGTTLLLTVTGPLAAAAVPTRTMATVGLVGPMLPRATPGTFAAEYRVPSDRVPQSAIIAAEVSLPDGTWAHATTQLMLPAATTFPLRTSPDAAVSLEIAGHLFGPRRADPDGNVSIPIVVPPHVRVGRARAVNQFGIATETEVDLQPRDYPRVLLVAPADAEAGATVEVEVWAVEPTGDPSQPEDIDLRGPPGTVRRVGGMSGVARFAVTLPSQIGPAPVPVPLTGAMDDGTSSRTEEVLVRPGPVERIEITRDVGRLVVATAGLAHLTIVGRDQFGNPAPAPGMEVRADGQPLQTRPSPGGVLAEIGAPARWEGRDHVQIDALAGTIRASVALPLTGGPPTRVLLTANRAAVVGDGHSAVDLVLQIVDQHGTPTSAEGATWQTDGGGAIETLPAARFGTSAARFIPRRTPRDHLETVAVEIPAPVPVDAGSRGSLGDPPLDARLSLRVEAGATRAAAARVGLVSNLGSGFGQTAFVEATLPLRPFARLGSMGPLLSAGLALGYVHGQVTAASGTSFPPVRLSVNQFPLLALARLRVPAGFLVDFSLTGALGLTFAATEISVTSDSQVVPVTRGSARALVLGGGVEASIPLLRGELLVGARYLYAELGRSSRGDQLVGNALGLIGDLGFRVGF